MVGRCRRLPLAPTGVAAQRERPRRTYGLFSGAAGLAELELLQLALQRFALAAFILGTDLFLEQFLAQGVQLRRQLLGGGWRRRWRRSGGSAPSPASSPTP